LLSENLKKNNRLTLIYYISVILFLLIQSSVFIKYISITNFHPNTLLVLLIIFSLNNNFKDSLKFSLFIGIFKDLLNPNYILLDLPIYILYLFLIQILKGGIVSTNVLNRVLVAGFIIVLDFIIRNTILYFELGDINIEPIAIVHILVDISLFFLFDRIFSLISKKLNKYEF